MDVNLYDFDDLNETKNTRLVDADKSIDLINDMSQFNRTKLAFRPRYSSISSRNDSLDGKSNRIVSVREADLNKTFRVTNTTF